MSDGFTILHARATPNLYFYGLCILPAAPAIAPSDSAQGRRKPLGLLGFRRIVLAARRVITGADGSISGPRGGVGRAGSHRAGFRCLPIRFAPSGASAGVRGDPGPGEVFP